jgi:hypothetical protein
MCCASIGAPDIFSQCCVDWCVDRRISSRCLLNRSHARKHDSSATSFVFVMTFQVVLYDVFQLRDAQICFSRFSPRTRLTISSSISHFSNYRSTLRLPSGGNLEHNNTKKPNNATAALHTNTRCVCPTSASKEYSMPNTAVVDNLAMFSTRVIPLSASTRSLLGSICKMVPLDAAPVPAAKGSTSATTYICQPCVTNIAEPVSIESRRTLKRA